MTDKELIARRVAQFFSDGDVVNLGIGLPTLVANYIPEGVDVWLDSENGVLGICGAAREDMDTDLVDASGVPARLRKGECCFDSFTSFGLIRGGHVDYTVLGAYEVDAQGNLANWTVPGKTIAGMGGAMDLTCGARQVLVATTHTDKDGNPKILERCTLPLTAAHEVDYIITELCVLKVAPEGLILMETAPGVTADEVQSKTAAKLTVPEQAGGMMA